MRPTAPKKPAPVPALRGAAALSVLLHAALLGMPVPPAGGVAPPPPPRLSVRLESPDRARADRPDRLETPAALPPTPADPAPGKPETPSPPEPRQSAAPLPPAEADVPPVAPAEAPDAAALTRAPELLTDVSGTPWPDMPQAPAGAFLLAVTVGADGGVSAVEAECDALLPGLCDAAEAYAAVVVGWRFRPGERNGLPVESRIRLDFQLGPPPPPSPGTDGGSMRPLQ